MKYLFWGLILSFIFISCGNQIEKDAAGNEKFDSFVREFFSSEKFQLSRIQFPIAGKKVDGSYVMIEEKDWKVLKPIDEKDPLNKTVTFKISSDYIKYSVVVGNAFSIDMEFNLDKTSKKWYLSSYSGMSATQVESQVDPELYDTSRQVLFKTNDNQSN